MTTSHRWTRRSASHRTRTLAPRAASATSSGPKGSSERLSTKTHICPSVQVARPPRDARAERDPRGVLQDIALFGQASKGWKDAGKGWVGGGKLKEGSGSKE